MFELTRKVLSGTVLAAITGGVLLWGLSPGMTLKREYESYNGKPAGSEHTLQAITVPAYANVQGVTALEACTLQDGILVLAYPTCPYCRNLMPELLDAAKRQIQVCITVHLTSTGMFIPMMRRRECQC